MENQNRFFSTPTSSNSRSPLQEISNNNDSNENELNVSADSNLETATKRKRKISINVADARWTNGRAVSGKYSNMFVHLLDSGRESEFLRCNLCDFYCLNNHSRQTSMKRHRNVHIKTEEIPKLEAELRNKQVMMALKGRSFLLIEDQSLKDILRTFGKLSAVCAKTGVPCEPDDIFMSRRSLSRRIRDLTLADERTNAFLALVELVKIRGCLTFDFGHNLRDFFVLTAHVIDQNGSLRPFVLHFAEWTETSKRREEIDSMIRGVLVQNHFDQKQMSLMSTVTDEGSNVINCFGSDKHFFKFIFLVLKSFKVRCACHIVNTVSKHVLEPYADFDDYLDRETLSLVLGIVKQVESFVRNARKIPIIVDNCGPCLYEPVETRWLSRYRMCRTFLNSVEEIGHVFSAHYHTHLVEKHTDLCTQFRKLVQNEILYISAFVEVLRPLFEALPKLESVKTPTLNILIRTFSSFLLHFNKIEQDFVYDSPEATLSRAAKHALMRKIEKSLNVKLLKCASFLDPLELRRVRAICDRVTIWGTSDSFKYATLEIFNSSGIDDEETVDLANENEEFPLDSPITDVECEIGAYLAIKIDPKEFDVLLFWNTAGKMFPLLRQLALKVLAIPCSTAHSERAFSRLHHLCSSYRRSLSSETISAIMCLGSLEFEELFDDI